MRHVAFHGRHPLFASCSEDGSAHVSHGKVFDDLMQNPLVVPVKSLKTSGSVPLTSCVFHPFHPWLFAVGENSLMNLYVPTLF